MKRPPDCIHRGASIRQSAALTLTLPTDATTVRTYAIFACSVYGECLPTFRCTTLHKGAVREAWTRDDGGDAYGLHACRGCDKRVDP